MKTTAFSLPLIILVLAFIIPPVAMVNLVSLGAGVFLVSSISTNLSHRWTPPSDPIPVLTQLYFSNDVADTVYPLGKGYVSIRTVNGKLVTRFTRHDVPGPSV